MTRRYNRWFLYGPFIFAGVILAGWFYLWRSGAQTMRRSLDEFVAMRAKDGVTVVHGPLKTGGFPFFLRGAVDQLSIDRGQYRYACDRLYVDALPYARGRIIFSCGAEQRFITPSGAWIIDAKDGRASVERDAQRGWMVRIETGKASAVNNNIEVSVGGATINFAPAQAVTGEFDASMRILDISVTRSSGVYAVDRIDAAATFSKPESGAGRRAAIHGLELAIGDTILKAEGEMALPATGTAQGSFNTRIEKPVGLARMLADAGLLNAEEAITAESGLAMLAVASGGAISAPVELKDGELRLAGFRLARFGSTVQP